MREIIFGDNGMYKAREDGKIFTRSSLKRGRTPGIFEPDWREKKQSICRTDKHGGSYLASSFKINSKFTSHKIHRLIAKLFLGEIPNGLQINHIDGNRFNNSVKNLEIVTPKDNMANAKNRGALERRSSYGGKLSRQNIITIKSLGWIGFNTLELSSWFNVDRSVITRIISSNKQVSYQETNEEAISLCCKLFSLEYP